MDITGTNGPDTLLGTESNDWISLLGGNDFCSSYAGDDDVSGGAGNDLIYAGADRDTIGGGGGDDTVYCGVGDDRSGGEDGNDALFGEIGVDILYGENGDDILNGGAGSDSLDGGDGFDTADYSSGAGSITVNLTSGRGAGGHAAGDRLVGIENVVGTFSDDFLVGSAAGNRLTGSGGDDRLIGLAGDDQLDGGTGADRLDGGDGFDIANYTSSDFAVTINLTSGRGSGGEATGDRLFGIEQVLGSAFADFLYGSAGADTLRGQDGADRLISLGGADSLQGAGGDDSLRGGAGADVLDGGAGFDAASYISSGSAVTIDLTSGLGFGGEAAGDRLFGIEGVLGSQFGDSISGDAGANRILAGGGADILRGRGGADIFEYDDISDSIIVNPDYIGDFDGRYTDVNAQNGGDRIDLLSIDANANVAGDQAFTFIGQTAFTGVAGQLRYYRQPAYNEFGEFVGGAEFIYGDVDGDGAEDFSIWLDDLNGTRVLYGEDFIL